MPNCADNYDKEIAEGKNANSVLCKYCSSKILSPSTADFYNSEFQLPLIKQITGSDGVVEKEAVSVYWEVGDIYVFENIGFSNTVGNHKYLTCADCEVGPIGYHDLTTKKSYIALSRVVHSQ